MKPLLEDTLGRFPENVEFPHVTQLESGTVVTYISMALDGQMYGFLAGK